MGGLTAGVIVPWIERQSLRELEGLLKGVMGPLGTFSLSPSIAGSVGSGLDVRPPSGLVDLILADLGWVQSIPGNIGCFLTSQFV
jgi:hypothetical protein